MFGSGQRPMDTVEGRVLGIDPGTKRLGFALSDDLRWTVRPLEVWTRRSLEQDLAHIAALIEKHEIVELVVGVPLCLDGKESRSTHKARAFAEAIRGRFPDMAVAERDEALTTWQAERMLQERGLLPQDRRKHTDAFAAAVILQEELDARSQASPPPSTVPA